MEVISYDREKLDDYGRRNTNKDSYKNRTFDGMRTTTDEYTGQKIYYSQTGANSQSTKRHFTSNTTSNTDHVIPLEEINRRYGGKISEENLKKLANSDYNLKMTNEKLNKAKGSKSNAQYLFDEFKKGNPKDIKTSVNMVSSQVNAQTRMDIDFGKMKIEETLNSMDIKSTSIGLNNLASIASGEKTVEQAMLDIAREGTISGVSDLSIETTQNAVKAVAEKCKNPTFKKILANDLPIAELSIGVMVTSMMYNVLNGNISPKDCINEVMFNGAGLLAYSMGMALGGIGGATAATLIVSKIATAATEYKIDQRIDRQKQQQIDMICAEASIVIKEEKQKVEMLMLNSNRKMAETFRSGFEQILDASYQNSTDGISEGLDIILSKFNSEVMFKNMNEFMDFIEDDDTILRF